MTELPTVSVCSVLKLDVANGQLPSAVVVALAPRDLPPELGVDGILRLSFNDIEVPYEDGLKGVSHRQMHEFLDWSSDKRDVLVCCKLGLSRSPALAIVMLVSRGVDAEEACEMVATAIPLAMPNRWVLHVGGLCLGLGSSIKTAAKGRFPPRRFLSGPTGSPQSIARLERVGVQDRHQAGHAGTIGGDVTGGSTPPGAAPWPAEGPL